MLGAHADVCLVPAHPRVAVDPGQAVTLSFQYRKLAILGSYCAAYQLLSVVVSYLPGHVLSIIHVLLSLCNVKAASL